MQHKFSEISDVCSWNYSIATAYQYLKDRGIISKQHKLQPLLIPYLQECFKTIVQAVRSEKKAEVAKGVFIEMRFLSLEDLLVPMEESLIQGGEQDSQPANYKNQSPPNILAKMVYEHQPSMLTNQRGKSRLKKTVKQPFPENLPANKPKKIFGILHSFRQENLAVKLSELLAEQFSENSDTGYLFFTISSLDLNKGTVEGMLCSSEGLQPAFSVIPDLIYNVAIHSKPASINIMRQLRTHPKIKVVNPVNSFQQDVLLEIIASNPKSKGFFLLHQPFLKSSFEKLLYENKQIFLLPNKIYGHPELITVFNRKNKVFVKAGRLEHILSDKNAFDSIQLMIGNRRFLMLEGIHTLNWNNHPAECRVYVQKDLNGTWKITSRILKNESFTRGSVSHRHSEKLEQALSRFNKKVMKTALEKTEKVPLLFASYLDYFIPNVGSYYFDFLLDTNGHPFLFYTGGVERTDFLARSSEKEWENYLINLISYLHYCDKEIRLPGTDEYVD